MKLDSDMRVVRVCVDDLGIVSSGDLGQRWPTSKSWEKSMGEEHS